MHANRYSVCFPHEMRTLLIDHNRGLACTFIPLSYDISDCRLRLPLSDQGICWGPVCVCTFVIAIRDLWSLYRNVELFVMFFKGTLCTFQKALQNESFTSGLLIKVFLIIRSILVLLINLQISLSLFKRDPFLIKNCVYKFFRNGELLYSTIIGNSLGEIVISKKVM